MIYILEIGSRYGFAHECYEFSFYHANPQGSKEITYAARLEWEEVQELVRTRYARNSCIVYEVVADLDGLLLYREVGRVR